MKLVGIPSNVVGVTWHLYEGLIQEALEHSRGECWAEDILQGASEGWMQIWVARNDGNEPEKMVEAVMVTQIIHYPRKSFLRIVVLAGKSVHRFDDAWDVIEDWAREQGCSGVESLARPGFSRWAQSKGFRAYYTVVGKDIPAKTTH